MGRRFDRLMDDKIKILLVDDDKNILNLLSQLVDEMESFERISVDSAHKALDVMAREKVSILVTDQMMPGMTGNELLSIVTEKYPDTIKILITANTDIHVAMEAINRGKIYAYLNKPIDDIQFFSVLKKAREVHFENENKKKMFRDVERILSDTVIEDYRIVQKIGEGGMGDVFKAYCEREKRFIALKVLKDKVHSPLDRERFKREALACERVKHSGIVKILAKGESNTRLFIAEEFLEGESLHDLIPKLNCSDLPYLCRIGLGIIRIVRAIHEAKIIHRDLKPSNIFIIKGEAPVDERIKILDFGIARMSDMPRITETGILEGTAEFIAPESMSSRYEPTPAMDIYGYGVILYFLFFQVSPFEKLNIKEIIQHKMKHNIAIPAQTSIPREIGQLILSLTERDPGKRLMDYDRVERVLKGCLS